MATAKKLGETYDILKNYSGNNPYILTLKRNIFVYNNKITDFVCDYVLNNYKNEPKIINKTIKIADWFGESKKKDLELDFTPTKIKIISYLGEVGSSYHCMIQYRQSVPPEMWFLPKKAVLKDFLSEDYHNINVDFEKYNNLIHKIDENRNLKPHQEEGIKFLLSRKQCILADSMGLGKTCTLSAAAIEGNFDSVLIICPASLKTNWKNELNYFVDDKDISIIDGFINKNKGELETFLGYEEGKSNKTKDELLKEAKTSGKWQINKFVIINFDILDEFFEMPRGRSNSNFDECLENSPLLRYIYNKRTLIIIDEVHKLSDNKSIRYKIIKFLIKKGKPDSVYLSTGTPLTNNPANLYNLLDLIKNDITDDWEYYMKRYCGGIKICAPKDKPKRDSISKRYIANKGKSNWYDLSQEEKNELQSIIEKNCKMQLIYKEPTNLEELRDRISHLYLRRTKEDMDMPEKEIHELYYNLTEFQKNEYDKLWDEYEKSKKEEGKNVVNKELIEGGIYRRYLSNEMVKNTIKVTDFLLSKNEKTIIACCYDEELYSLKDYYKEKCVIFNGKMSLKQKDNAVEQFSKNPDIMVFIANIISGGVGINLISSSHLVFNDFDWTYSNNSQMEDRIWRLGQKKKCHIYYQIFHDTEYEHMWDTVLRKKIISETVIKNENEKRN